MTHIEQMMDFCDKQNIIFFHHLVDSATKKRRDWLRTLNTDRGTDIMSKYLADKAFAAKAITEEQYREIADDDVTDFYWTQYNLFEKPGHEFSFPQTKNKMKFLR